MDACIQPVGLFLLSFCFLGRVLDSTFFPPSFLVFLSLQLLSVFLCKARSSFFIRKERKSGATCSEWREEEDRQASRSLPFRLSFLFRSLFYLISFSSFFPLSFCLSLGVHSPKLFFISCLGGSAFCGHRGGDVCTYT